MYYGVASCIDCSILVLHFVYDKLQEDNLRYNCFAGWKIREAEILDIFAYKMSTKEVVSSGKTSWSATGNEKYYEVTGEK